VKALAHVDWCAMVKKKKKTWHLPEEVREAKTSLCLDTMLYQNWSYVFENKLTICA
jgi:hypothetical protein